MVSGDNKYKRHTQKVQTFTHEDRRGKLLFGLTFYHESQLFGSFLW